jgi:hypothetical protein
MSPRTTSAICASVMTSLSVELAMLGGRVPEAGVSSKWWCGFTGGLLSPPLMTSLPCTVYVSVSRIVGGGGGGGSGWSESASVMRV